MHYKKTVRKLYDTGWKKSYHTSVDFSMIGYGCGVFKYPQLFFEYLDMYQVLPRSYLISFGGGHGYKLILKNGCQTWQVKQKHLSWVVLNPG